jgi:hypothetical protein
MKLFLVKLDVSGSEFRCVCFAESMEHATSIAKSFTEKHNKKADDWLPFAHLDMTSAGPKADEFQKKHGVYPWEFKMIHSFDIEPVGLIA